jgi:L-methionine (R)-S-oxide reductase
MIDIQTRLEQALDEAIAKLNGDSGTLHLKEPDAKVLRLMASRSIPAPVLEAVRRVPWGKGMAGVAAERAEPVDHCNIQSSTSSDIHPGARQTGVQGAIVVPILHGADVVGTIGIGCLGEHTFSADETRWLLEFGRRIAMEVGTAAPV